ncbi:MAG: ATP-dependent DNA helicase RecG, partial [Rubrivivax sp.]
MPEAAATPQPASKSAPQKAMEKLGLLRDIDLALHLPMRYEDETQLIPIAALRENETAQVEGVVIDCQVELRSR